MIEMVYRGTSKDGKGKERTGLPKNIRQIGDAGSDKRVYIEDYVITFLEKTGCAVLLGEVWQNENMKCLFADGAVEIAEGEPNDDMWEKIYREMKQYFPGREVIGWAKKMEEPEEEPDEKLFDLHREQFPGEDRLLFLYDSEENASVFLTENTGIRKQSGYYIYYEKNEQMQSYMVKENEGQSRGGGIKESGWSHPELPQTDRKKTTGRTERGAGAEKQNSDDGAFFIWCKYVSGADDPGDRGDDGQQL